MHVIYAWCIIIAQDVLNRVKVMPQKTKEQVTYNLDNAIHKNATLELYDNNLSTDQLIQIVGANPDIKKILVRVPTPRHLAFPLPLDFCRKLIKIDFDGQLKIITEKAKGTNSQTAAQTLVADLLKAKERAIWEHDSNIDIDTRFKNECLQAIQTFKKSLSLLGNWEQILAKMSNDIVSDFQGYENLLKRKIDRPTQSYTDRIYFSNRSLKIKSIPPFDASSDVLTLFEISETFKGVDLSENDFGNLSNDVLLGFFAKLPATVTELDLSSNDLNYKTDAELAAIFAKFPVTMTSVNLSNNNLNEVQLTQIAKALPPTVQVIKLENNKVLSLESYRKLIASDFESHLKFINDRAKTLNPEAQKEELAAVQQLYTRLVAGKDKYLLSTSLSTDEKNYNFRNKCLRSIRFVKNKLINKGDWEHAFVKLEHAVYKNIQSTIRFIHHAEITIERFSVPVFIIYILHDDGKFFDLRSIPPINITSDDLAKIFEKIPETVNFASLSGYLTYINSEVLANAFGSLPKNVTELNLSNNGIEKRPNAEFNKIISAIPDSVQYITLDGENKFSLPAYKELIKMDFFGHYNIFYRKFDEFGYKRYKTERQNFSLAEQTVATLLSDLRNSEN